MRADQAEAEGDPKMAVEALERALHIMSYYPPSREVVRDRFPDPDPFAGYFPKAALASEMFHHRALLLEAKGMLEEAEAERERARRASPFLRLIQ